MSRRLSEGWNRVTDAKGDVLPGAARRTPVRVFVSCSAHCSWSGYRRPENATKKPCPLCRYGRVQVG